MGWSECPGWQDENGDEAEVYEERDDDEDEDEDADDDLLPLVLGKVGRVGC
jgi:hypothetical protein